MLSAMITGHPKDGRANLKITVIDRLCTNVTLGSSHGDAGAIVASTAEDSVQEIPPRLRSPDLVSSSQSRAFDRPSPDLRRIDLGVLCPNAGSRQFKRISSAGRLDGLRDLQVILSQPFGLHFHAYQEAIHSISPQK
jgi:hypothetical protein